MIKANAEVAEINVEYLTTIEGHKATMRALDIILEWFQNFHREYPDVSEVATERAGDARELIRVALEKQEGADE